MKEGLIKSKTGDTEDKENAERFLMATEAVLQKGKGLRMP